MVESSPECLQIILIVVLIATRPLEENGSIFVPAFFDPLTADLDTKID